MKKLKNIQDVVDWGLCVGCGVCFDTCSSKAIQLTNVEQVGIRPFINKELCSGCGECIEICPGYVTDTSIIKSNKSKYNTLIGSYKEIWQGYSSDIDIRKRASSGGVISALSLYCINEEESDFVVHAGMDKMNPIQNRTHKSKNKEEILQRCGSRYSPASPGDTITAIESTKKSAVFVGKPCDAAGAYLAKNKRDKLQNKLKLIISFFCAGTPSTYATKKILKDAKFDDLSSITNISYRGDGWPGNFRIMRNGVEKNLYSYEESWGKLNKYRPFRCQICPDGLGNSSDISCGDAWHEYANDKNPGLSIVITRSDSGQEIFHKAIRQNYVKVFPIESSELIKAQENLLLKKKEIFGRLLAMRLLFIPIPNFRGFSLFSNWNEIPAKKKIRSILGTMKRLITRNLWKPNTIG